MAWKRTFRKPESAEEEKKLIENESVSLRNGQ